MSIPFWEEASNEYQTVRLGNYDLPGKAEVNVKLNKEYDIKKTQDKNLATMQYKGNNLRDVAIKLHILNREEWNQAQQILPLLAAINDNATTQPLDIKHPNCALWGIQQVVITDIDSPPPTRNGVIISITCKQYAPEPKPAKSSDTIKKNDNQSNTANPATNPTPQYRYKHPEDTTQGILERAYPERYAERIN